LATGPLNKPDIPNVPGLDTFEGPHFHSSQWRHDIDLRGKRVAVVGTGASAIQFVPEIAPLAAEVQVFQRTAAWVVPRWDTPFSRLKRSLFRRVPGLQAATRWRIYWFNEMVGMGFMGARWVQAGLKWLSTLHMNSQVSDTQMRAALTPTFAPGCKRLLISNTWYPTLQLPHVKLQTQAVAGVTGNAVVGADGVQYPCDVIIWGTGFKAAEMIAPIKVYGEPEATGNAQELGALWRSQAARTHLGITVAGFPNLFMLVGQQSGLGHNSIIFMIECQVNYIVDALKKIGAAVLRLRPEVQLREYAELQKKMQRTVWASGCKSWYQNAQGNIDTLWPDYTWQYWLKTRRFSAADYL
jgi:cation diffusion facilitator CzcD-associated flavoprotein CzcO